MPDRLGRSSVESAGRGQMTVGGSGRLEAELDLASRKEKFPIPGSPKMLQVLKRL